MTSPGYPKFISVGMVKRPEKTKQKLPWAVFYWNGVRQDGKVALCGTRYFRLRREAYAFFRDCQSKLASPF